MCKWITVNNSRYSAERLGKAYEQVGNAMEIYKADLKVKYGDDIPRPYIQELEYMEMAMDALVECGIARYETAREIFDRLYALIKFDGHTVAVWKNDLISLAKEYGVELEKDEDVGNAVTT